MHGRERGEQLEKKALREEQGHQNRWPLLVEREKRERKRKSKGASEFEEAPLDSAALLHSSRPLWPCRRLLWHEPSTEAGRSESRGELEPSEAHKIRSAKKKTGRRRRRRRDSSFPFAPSSLASLMRSSFLYSAPTVRALVWAVMQDVLSSPWAGERAI